MSRIPPAPLVLGLAGLIPFIVLTLALWIVDDLPRFSLVSALLAYGAVILSFLGGVKWGQAIATENDPSTGSLWRALSLAVCPSLLGWVALLLPQASAILLLLTGFILQYLLDRHWVKTNTLPLWYGKLRLILTSVVTLCLTLSMVCVLLLD